ncbi:MAG: hypothetical protein ACK4YP_11170 [Myxococcota bacterium]
MPVATKSQPLLPRRRRGQATTEWMLLLSVLVLAIVAAGYALAKGFGDGMRSLSPGNVYTSGDLGG